MENRLKWMPIGVVVALFVLCCSTKCQSEEMNVAFIQEQNGLRPEHKTATPFFEEEFCMPDMPACEVKRVYSDGALYLLNRSNPDSVSWAYLTKVKEAGLKELKDIFVEVCDVNEIPGKAPAELGSSTYRFHTEDCTKEVVINGIDYGPYAPLERVTNAVNFNLEQIRTGK